MNKKSKQFEITITVDTNDGDYITAVNQISEKDLETIKPLIAAIKKFKPYTTRSSKGSYDHSHDSNFPYGDCCREDLGEKTVYELYDFPEEVFEIFQDFLPGSEYGFHTIDSVEVTPFLKKTKLL
jgi:hypothetical protein